MNTSTQSKSWMITLPLAGAAAAYVFLVFLPAQRRIGDIRDELNTKREFIANAQMLAPSVLVAHEKLAALTGHDERWQRQTPSRSQLPAVFAGINLAARAAGATTTQFEPQTPIPHETVTQYPLKMSVLGSHQSILRFVRSLERMPASIWVNDLRLEVTRESGENLQCEVDLGVFCRSSE